MSWQLVDQISRVLIVVLLFITALQLHLANRTRKAVLAERRETTAALGDVQQLQRKVETAWRQLAERIGIES